MGTAVLRDILATLGFEEDWSEMTDHQPSYVRTIGAMRVRASELMSQQLRPVFGFSGTLSTSRTAGAVWFEVPLEYESYEQGVAWVVWNLDQQFSKDLAEPEWLLLGRKWKDHLPWIRRVEGYQTRPQCKVVRDWLRVAARQLRQASTAAGGDANVSFEFDGSALRIRGTEVALVMPAIGSRPWPTPFTVRLGDACRATRRLMQETIQIGVWEGNLDIGSHRLPLKLDAQE